MLALLVSCAVLLPQSVQTPLNLGSHVVRYAKDGSLLPWTSWRRAIDLEMDWYSRCPLDHGYPKFVNLTFMDASYNAQDRKDCIPAMQTGVAILSYLKYDELSKGRRKDVLQFARAMGDYLLKEANTPNEGKYPTFPRSTGHAGQFPLPADCGSQDDQPYDIQPDKGSIAGYALLRLYERTKDARYLDQAAHIADVLTANMSAGDAEHSPWPFRADYRTGVGRGNVAGNTSYFLRLFEGLERCGYPRFSEPRRKLWRWVKQVQIPNAEGDGRLFAQFFEDHHNPGNRSAWGPLNLARYLIEGKEKVDPEWRQDAKKLIEFINQTFVHVRFGVAVCGEQDEDVNPWGGINSTWGAVLAMYSSATGSKEYKRVAEQALTFCLYAIDENGCPRDTLLSNSPGGWQEDAHTDKIHNIVDAIHAFPEWGK